MPVCIKLLLHYKARYLIYHLTPSPFLCSTIKCREVFTTTPCRVPFYAGLFSALSLEEGMSQVQEYWLPGYGLSRSIVLGHLQYFLGPSASVRPYSMQVS